MNFTFRAALVFVLLILAFGFIFLKTTTRDNPLPPTMEEGKVKYPADYLLVLVGDSMTEALGNSDELRVNLEKYYPGKTFEFLNYGFGATNILSLKQRLLEKTNYGREFRPITDIDFDLILIESFGHNPLSEFPLDEGLKKQTEILDEALKIIKEKNPDGKIIFVATIAPSKRNYGKGQVDLSDEKRRQWAEERKAYIKNHIEFAKKNNIPLINIFEKSQIDGDLNLEYVRSDDYIHPSPKGVRFISGEIADFLFENKILE